VGGEAGAEGRRLCGMVADGIESGGLFGVCNGRGVGRVSEFAFRFESDIVVGKLCGGGGRGSWLSSSVSMALRWR